MQIRIKIAPKNNEMFIYIYTNYVFFVIIAILWALLESTTGYYRIWTKKSKILMSKHACTANDNMIPSSRIHSLVFPPFPGSSVHWAKPKHTLPSRGRKWVRVCGRLGALSYRSPVLSFILHMVMNMFSIIWWCISRFSIIWWSTVLMVYNTQHFLVYNMAMVIMTCVLVMSYLDWTSNVILQLLLHNKKHVCYC